MGLFSDMEKFGLKNFKDAKVIDKDKPVDVDIAKLKPKAPEKNETDALFTKHYTCPVCDLKFVTRSIRAGRVKLLEKDIDLRPIEANLKLEFGHFEADSIESCKKRNKEGKIQTHSCLTVLVDRLTRKTVIKKTASKTSQATTKSIVSALKPY